MAWKALGAVGVLSDSVVLGREPTKAETAVFDEAVDRERVASRNVLNHPIADWSELLEKADLFSRDCGDEEKRLDALIDHIRRISSAKRRRR